MDEETSKQLFEKVDQTIQAEKTIREAVLAYEQDNIIDHGDGNDLLPLVTNPQLFIDIENDMRDVEKNFSSDPALEAFKSHFEAHYHAMGLSKETENKLMRRSKEIKAEINVNKAKIGSAIALTREQIREQDEKIKEINDRWRNSEEIATKINDNESQIIALEKELIETENQINHAKQSGEAEKQKKISEMTKKREDAERSAINQKEELDRLRAGNDRLNDQNQSLKDQNISMLQSYHAKQAERDRLEREKEEKQNKIENVEKEKERLHNELIALKASSQAKTEELEDQKRIYEGRSKDWKEELKSKETLRHTIQSIENSIKSFEKECEKIKPIIKAIDDQVMDHSKEIAHLKRREAEFNKDKFKTESEFKALMNLDEDVQRHIDELRVRKEAVETDIKNYLDNLDKSKKHLTESLSEQEERFRDKGKMEQKIKEHRNAIHKMDMDCQQLESRAKKLENQNKGYEIESIRLNNQIKDLQNQQAKYGAEASTAHARFYQTVEELKIKNTVIDEMQKKNVDLENKLKHQQNLYEAVRSDRNLYSKNLLEAQHETTSLLTKFTMMSHSINQLKEENRRKDEQFMKESLNHNNAVKQLTATGTKERVIRKNIEDTKEFIKHHETQIAKLKYIIGEAQAEKQKQIKDKEMVLNERDILGAQLIKRNQELDVLYEKIKISQSNLSKGEKHFRDKQSELINLKSDLSSQRQELVDSQDSVANRDQFRNEINSLEKELLKEKTKNRALEDELEYPMNVHRWKRMEATDPENYERIMKIQTLQRRLITKTQEVEEKDKLIKEKEILYVKLKDILARQPGAEIYSQEEIFRTTLKDKTGQLMNMLTELKDTQSKVKAHKYEIGMLNDQIGKMKREYLSKRDTEERAKIREMQENMVPNATQNKQAYYASLGITPEILGATTGTQPVSN